MEPVPVVEDTLTVGNLLYPTLLEMTLIESIPPLAVIELVE
jgi:hypothetical protein